ncbi:Dnah7 [Symbiodinium sp. KB8]|nr:Dnah7 [Symbiodinium sp. KB8]
MMVPDYALIGEIVLYSVGFGNAKPLAAKAVASLRLGSEQLSSQDHYDFGMRALKSILVAAGQLRKKFGSSRAEDILMLSALNDVNLPKFTSNDIPLFLGITGDLFPGVKLPPSDYGKLINELEGAARARHLQPKASFIHKCTQLWETIMVRHGLMVVGMNVSGKSEVENVLAAALAAVADGDLYLPCQIHKINPKSIKQGQLYGDFDENTHEWTDGILALTVRYTANADPSHRQWIMLDGPVDAVWIENMNTVLDDNKKLCLNSGEIIKLSPVTTMMFEVEDLSAASPATVSRCGMVFMEQVVVCVLSGLKAGEATVPQRDRVFAFRDFVVRTFEEELRSGPVLDMAGGKGDLSWLLVNADAADAVVVDPRVTDHTKISRTAMWHFETRDWDIGDLRTERGPQGPLRALRLEPPFAVPRHLRVFMDHDLLAARQSAAWEDFWTQASNKAEALTERGAGHHQSSEQAQSQGVLRAQRIQDPAEAATVLESCSLILGFHPDQATEPAVDLAVQQQIPFAVCPCCVFPKEFPQRKLCGHRVKTYPEFIEYLRRKHPSMRTVDLAFEPEGGYARSTVLYMKAEDFARRIASQGGKSCRLLGEADKQTFYPDVMFRGVRNLTCMAVAMISSQVDIGWIETAPERLQDCSEQLKGLFEANIDQCWEMCQRKIKTPVPVTQNWLVCSLLKLLMALLRCELPLDPEKDKQDLPMKEKEVKVENMFWLALVWSFGATTDSAGRKIMNSFIRSIQQGMPVKEEFDLIADDPTMRPVTKTPFPEKDTVYEYFAFAQSNKWENWTKKITGFDIPKEALAHQVMVPTADTVRSAFLLQSLVASEYHILYSGLTGTGKTVVIQQELLKRFDKDKYTVISFAFSAQTNANQTQDIIDGKLDKRKKGTYGPPFGKKCLLFIDDLNMPAKEKYGAQPPIELLRQWMDTQGWYERKTAEFRNLVDLIFIGAMGPPGAGRPFLTGRFQRHFNLVFVTPFEQESLQRIFQTIMQWFLGRFPGAVAGVANAVVRSTIQLYEDMSAAMLPTPAKSHYTFNLRDLAKVHLGICRCQKKSMESADDLARCWAHEAHRVFFDRLVTKDDQTWFREKMSEILKENFKKDWKSLVKVEPLIWCDFIDPRASHYQQVEDPDQIVEALRSNQLGELSLEVGVGGSGRKSLATLAAFVAEQETFQIEITKSYGMNDWHEDIKRLLIRCGGQMKEAASWAGGAGYFCRQESTAFSKAWKAASIMESRETAFAWTCVALRLAYRLAIAQIQRQGILVLKLLCTAVTRRAEILQEDEWLVVTETKAKRVRLAHAYFSVLVGATLLILLVIQRTSMKESPFGSEAWRWLVLTIFGISVVYVLVPSLRRPCTHNYWYAFLMAIGGTAIIYQAANPEDPNAWSLPQASLQITGLVRIPAVCLTKSIPLVALCNVAIIVLAIVFSPAALIGLELVSATCAVIAAIALQVLLKQSAERSLNISKMSSDLQAARALLQLICDAVVELDESLRLSHHSPELAAILLRDASPGRRSLQGTRFRDFVATPEEAAKAQKELLGVSSRSAASAFHTRLVDAYNSKFRTEVFHVRYQQNGRTSHLIGLRDFTDQTSLARNSRIDSNESALNVSSDKVSLSRPSPLLPQYNVLLLVDLSKRVVEAASISAFGLVGAGVLDLFPQFGAELLSKVCFLLPDTQIANENFVEEVSGLLNTGEVPNLFNAEDKTQILELCTNVAAKEGRHGPAEVMAFFIEQCMKNMHIVLAFSPIGENFRRRVRMFPSLVNCCTIDWFHEWPDAALQSVANHFLGKTGMPDDVLKGVVNVCVAMQKSVFTLAERFQKEVQRHYYVTPTSYLELINAFKGLLANKQDEVSKIKSRYDVGLDKIMSTEEQVTTMQAELEELKPTLKKTAEETVSKASIGHDPRSQAKWNSLITGWDSVVYSPYESARA